MWGDLTAKRTWAFLDRVELPSPTRTRLQEALKLLEDVRHDFPRLHPVVTHYQKGAMAPQERRYKYLIARSFGLDWKTSARLRDFRDHVFFRWLVEVLTSGPGSAKV